MTFSEINAHTAPLFSQLGILKVYDVHQFQLLSFVYACHCRLAPVQFHSYFKPSFEVHNYNTSMASRGDLFLQRKNTFQNGIRCIVERISSLKEKIRSPKQKILNDPDVKDTLRRLHDDFVLVPADKAANNVIVVCKKYHIETLIKELGINTTIISPNSTYILSTDSFDKILKSHCKFIESVGLEMSGEDKNLSYLYWTPKLHKVPFKHRFIAGSSKYE